MSQIESKRTEKAFPGSERRTVDLPQGPIQYYDIGSGEPVLFVHGAFVDGNLWRNVAEPLSDTARCLVPTLPLGGHDVAMDPDADLTPSGVADLLAQFLDEIGVERVTLVGNDTGGAICQVFLAAYPERVERLVLTNCDAFDNFPPIQALPFVWGARIPGAVGLFARVLGSQRIRRQTFALLAKHPIQPDVLDGYTDSLRSDAAVRRDLRKALLGVSPEYTNEAATVFPTFDRPVLLAWAPEDPIFPLEDAQALADRFPNARLERVDGSNALVPEDQPDRLVDLLVDFLSASVQVPS
ncbi:alpha/beta fold hydrolase [Halorientalis pallida]|uniref:Alpha/beta hydrolase n=1 Tax=Halorientalis pallida TaxID=2479928 RepID=A0A498L240_9EURY|nr:alpha/beta hydrolase [Halorientalis pallida]RXK49421.1 alpha/beta hydrolase [Halorientalis pallida]